MKSISITKLLSKKLHNLDLADRNREHRMCPAQTTLRVGFGLVLLLCTTDVSQVKTWRMSMPHRHYLGLFAMRDVNEVSGHTIYGTMFCRPHRHVLLGAQCFQISCAAQLGGLCMQLPPHLPRFEPHWDTNFIYNLNLLTVREECSLSAFHVSCNQRFWTTQACSWLGLQLCQQIATQFFF